MRKLFLNHSNGRAFPSFLNISRTLIPNTPSPAPSSLPLQTFTYTQDLKPHYVFPSVPFSDSAFDFATICIIFVFIVLSLICVSFVFHLYIKSRRKEDLQNFNSFWIVRLMLIMFAIGWALNEVLSLPFFKRRYVYPFLPFLTLAQQADFCKVHVVLSFGFLQPGFLITLLFLVNISIKNKNLHCIWAFALICAMCCPLLLLQIYFVYYSPLENLVPTFMHISSILSTDIQGYKMVFCSYPLFSCIIFAGFAIAYSLAFLLSSWRVVKFVINKSIRGRLNVLSFTVLISLPVQILCLGVLPLWLPQDQDYYLVWFVMFLDVAFCMGVGQIILVFKPIVDALVACGEYRRWSGEIVLGRPRVIDDGGAGKGSI